MTARSLRVVRVVEPEAMAQRSSRRMYHVVRIGRRQTENDGESVGAAADFVV